MPLDRNKTLILGEEDRNQNIEVPLFPSRMLKTKKLKRNWGEEDLKILIWIVSKYCDYKGIQDIDKDLVNYHLFRPLKIGKLSPPSFRVSQQRHACSNGLASRKSH